MRNDTILPECPIGEIQKFTIFSALQINFEATLQFFNIRLFIRKILKAFTRKQIEISFTRMPQFPDKLRVCEIEPYPFVVSAATLEQ